MANVRAGRATKPACRGAVAMVRSIGVERPLLETESVRFGSATANSLPGSHSARSDGNWAARKLPVLSGRCGSVSPVTGHFETSDQPG